MERVNLRCYGQLAGWGLVTGLVAMLVGCGAPKGSTPALPASSARAVPESSPSAASAQSVPAQLRMVLADARPLATTSAAPIVAPALPKTEASPFELVGTSISATNTVAVLKEADQSRVTVHEGDTIDGYTIVAIAPDRVKVRSPDNDEQLLLLLAANGATTDAARTGGAGPEPKAYTGLITEGVNTDQSMPENVTYGPTGSLPEGVTQMGH